MMQGEKCKMTLELRNLELLCNGERERTTLPVWVAHLQVTASACRILLGAIWADDALNLLAQGLEGGVNLEVTVTHHIGIVSTV